MITFKENDTSTDVDKKPKSIVYFRFIPTVQAHYAVVLDMETKHVTEHNDVYLSCDGGFTMRRSGKHFEKQGFVKVYHNMNGRAVASFNKDFDPHFLTTTSVFQRNTQYECRIAGRSTMTTVHALYLFPCEGDQCEVDSIHWRRSLDVCDARAKYMWDPIRR